MSLKEPMSSCVPHTLTGVLPSSHKHQTCDTTIGNRDGEDRVPNCNHVVLQQEICSFNNNSKMLTDEANSVFLQQHPKNLFGIHVNSNNNNNNFHYCNDIGFRGCRQIDSTSNDSSSCFINGPNTCTESQKRHATISKEMEMHENNITKDTALPPLQLYDLNESNSPHLSRCIPLQRVQTVNNISPTHLDEPIIRKSPTSSQDDVPPCIIRTYRKPSIEEYNSKPTTLDLKGYPYCLNNETDFHSPNSDLASLNMASTNYRPLPDEYVSFTPSSLKSESPITKHNIYRGGKTNQSPPDLGFAINANTGVSLRLQQPQQQHQPLEQGLAGSSPMRATLNDQHRNDTNTRTTKNSFVHPQQKQKQPPPSLVEMNPIVGGGSFANNKLNNNNNNYTNGVNRMHSATTPYNNNNNNATNSMMINNSSSSSSNHLPYGYSRQCNSTFTPIDDSYSNNNLLIQQEQHNTTFMNNASQQSTTNPYRILPGVAAISRVGPISGSSMPLRDETIIQNSASSLLLSEQKQTGCVSGLTSSIDSRISAVAAVPVVQGCTERIIHSSIPHSSSSSSLQSKKQRMPSISASTNVPQSSSSLSMGSNLNTPSQQSNSLSNNNNTTKPQQTTNIKFHLLDDPNLKLDEHRSNFVRIDEEQIRKVFHLTQRQAAAFLGVSLSTLKRRFYEMRESLGMDKWPTTANGSTPILNTMSANGTNNSSSSRNNNKGSRKNSLQSDQTTPTTPQTNFNDNNSSYQYNNPSCRRTSVTSQDEFTMATSNTGNSLTNNHSPYLPQPNINNFPAVNISLPPIVTYSDPNNPTNAQPPQLPNRESLKDFLSRYAPKSFNDIAKDSDNSLPMTTSLKRRTNVFGQGHDPILIAKMFSDETNTSNGRKRSYPNISPNEIKEFEKEDNFPSQLPRHSSFSSQGSIDGLFEPPRKVNKTFPINKRGSTDENAEPKTNNPSNMSFILNEGVKDPTHLDKEDLNTLMEAFKKQ